MGHCVTPEWVFVVGDLESAIRLRVEMAVIHRVDWSPLANLGSPVVDIRIVVRNLVEDISAPGKAGLIEGAVDAGCYLLNIVATP